MYEMGRHIHACVLRSEKGCKIRVTRVHACSDCVHTRDATVRLNNASRLVRVIYSSHNVSIKLDTVTPLRRWWTGNFNGAIRTLFPCSSGNARRTCPGRYLAYVQRCLAGKRFSPVSALLPARALTVSHTRRDDASPTSVSKPRWWARSGAAAIVQVSTTHVSIAIPASEGGLKLFVELSLAVFPLHPSLLAVSSVVNGIPHSCCCGATANISGLSR